MLRLDTVGLCNQHFSELDIQTIRRHLKDAEAELGRIDERRRQLTKDICRYTNAIAPHNRVPEDVIRCIFECVVQDDTITFPFKRDAMGLAPPQVVLSHVCSLWRQVVLDMKSLWSYIIVVPQKNFRAFCETWSPRILLHLRVDLNSSDLKMSSASDRDLLFDPFLHFQFKEVEFVMTSQELQNLRQVSDDISLKVERVGLSIESDYERIVLPKFLSRSLHSFEIFCDGDDEPSINLEPIDIPWAQLRFLNLSDCDLVLSSRGIGMLRQCTSLELCKLRLASGDHENDLARNAGVMATEQVTLPVLQKFTIGVGSDAKGLCALSHFVLPSLRMLCVQGGKWTYDIQEVFRKQLNLHQLRELDIADVAYSPTIVSILRDAPLLRRLSLSPHAIFDEESLRGLGNGELGRHLEMLQLHNRSCNVDDMRRMVEARLETRRFIPGVAPLFHVRFKYEIQGGDGRQSRIFVVNNDMRVELLYVNGDDDWDSDERDYDDSDSE